MKRGYTLLELLVASMISAIVLVSLASSFLACERMIEIAVRETEFSLAGRLLRDRLLFAVAPPGNGVSTAGLLSGTNAAPSVLEGGASCNVLLTLPTCGANLGARGEHSLRLVMDQAHLVDERASSRVGSREWLRPGRLSLAETQMADIVTPVADGAGRTTSLVLDVTVKSTDAGMTAHRAERIRVPLLGRLQP